MERAESLSDFMTANCFNFEREGTYGAFVLA